MTTTDTTYLVLFAGNLAFIVTHLYGGLLKRFYRPEAYKEHFNELFPAQRAVSVIYLLQLFELPYLLQIGDSDALLYVNAFSLLFFSVQMLVMCEGYFFPEKRHALRDHWVFLPAVIVLIPMLLQAVDLLQMPEGWRSWFVGGVSVIFLFYLWRNIYMALKIKRAVRRANEDLYADSDDFPVRFANLIQWVPTGILMLLAINFYADNVWVKFVRDLLFIGASMWFCLLTLNPWRKLSEELPEIAEEQDIMEVSGDMEDLETPGHLLSDERCEELSQRLERLLREEKIFTERHITADSLIARLGTNSKYCAEVIRRSGYQSFYDMICQHRVRHAIRLIHQHPDSLMSDIADRCGFTSPASMAKAFKSQGKESPSSYRE